MKNTKTNGIQPLGTIIVIDDDATMRQFVACTLQEAGYRAEEAADGRSGVDLCDALLPDVIISDVVMDGLSGFDAVTALRENPATNSIPIILITAAADRQGMRRGMALGADDFIAKPFTAEDLLSTVKAKLEKRVAQRQHSDRTLQELRRNMTIAFPHELNTPLNGILGCAEMLLHPECNPAEVSLMARCIWESAKKLQRHADRFLIFAGMEIPEPSPTGHEPSRGSALTDDVLGTIAKAASKAAQRHKRFNDIHIDVIADSAPISAANLGFVVDELVDNGLKFSKKEQRVRLTATRDERSFCLRVVDEGRGMSRAQTLKIGSFAQFDRAQFSHEGLGLGLITVQRIAQIHGGSLTFQRPEIGGTRVCFYLPICATLR